MKGGNHTIILIDSEKNGKIQYPFTIKSLNKFGIERIRNKTRMPSVILYDLTCMWNLKKSNSIEPEYNGGCQG